LVWRVDGASRDIDAPAGVAFSRQISADSVEPTVASRSRNLLSHDDNGPTGTDEAMKVRPQMPWIICSKTFPGRAERLARTGAGPQRPVVRPSSKSSCDGPEAAPCKEMALGVSGEVAGPHVFDRSIVDVAWCDDVSIDEFSQDCDGRRIDFVVPGTSIQPRLPVLASRSDVEGSGSLLSRRDDSLQSRYASTSEL